MHAHALHAATVSETSVEAFPLILLLFAMGLWGSLTHCAGMCGPFVMSQVEQALGQPKAGSWGRLRGAALAPYHLGRMTTYAALGAAAGGLGGQLIEVSGWRFLAAALLILAAALFAAQALGLPLARLGGVPPLLGRLVSWLGRRSSAPRHYAMGLALGFLPCGLLYGALTAAAAAGDPLSGALAMGAFALGTVPALVMVGWGGVLLGIRRRRMLQRLTRPMLAANAVALLVLALGVAG